MFKSRLTKAVAGVLTVATFAWAMGFAIVPAQAAQRHTDGTVVHMNGTIYKIEDGKLRGFTSADIYFSHGYTFADAKPATDGDKALAMAAAMTWADGTLVNDAGTVYMVAEGQARAFTSAAVFTGLGFSFSNVVTGSVAGFSVGPVINSTTAAHPAGSLVLANGTVWMIKVAGKAGVPSMVVFNSYGWMFSHVVPGNAADVALTTLANVAARNNGGSLVDGGTVTPTPGETPGLEGTMVPTELAIPAAVVVEQGETEAVSGFKVEAKDSSISVERVDIDFSSTNTGDDTEDINPAKYLSSVALYNGSTLVKSMNVTASNFTATTVTTGSDTYRIRLSGFKSVIGKDSSANFYIHVGVKSDIAAADTPTGVNVVVPVEGLRGVDGAGINHYNTVALDKTFTIADEATLTLTVSAVANPADDRIQMVSKTSTTTGVELVRADVKVEDVAGTLDTVTATIATDDTNAGEVVRTAHLYLGNTLVGSEDVSTATGNTGDVNVTFDDLTAAVNGEHVLRVVVDLQPRGADASMNYAEGAAVSATITAVTVAWEDSEGVEQTTTDSDAVAGNDVFLYTVAPQVAMTSASITRDADATNEASATMTVTVKAVGGTIYVNGDQAAVKGISLDATGDATATEIYSVTGATTVGTGADKYYVIADGQTATFTVNSRVVNGATAQWTAAFVDAINWGTVVTDATTRSANDVPAGLLEGLTTERVYLTATAI